MEYQSLIVEQRDGVARVTLNRPDAANGLNLELSEELLDAATRFTGDPSVRAVLITGAGPRFCGGGDVKGFAEFGDQLGPKVRELTVPLHAAIARLVALDAPVITAVHGSVAGAGMGLVAAADLVVAAESTKFLLAYTAIGLTPDGGTSWFLPRLVGLRRSLDLALTNRVLSAAEACDWGIVSQVVADDELGATADALAARIAAGPTRAFGATKRLMNSSLAHTLEEQLHLESDTMEQAGNSADGQEGVASFVAKRPPEFRGA